MALKLSTGLANQLMSTSAGTPAGKPFGEIFKDGILKIYGGTRPADADTTEGSTALISITLSGATYTPADGTNGLELGDPTAGVIAIKSGETWKGTAGASGTATWFRFYPVGASVEGASTAVARFDGDVGTSGSDLNLTSTSITSGVEYTIATFTVTSPMA